MDWCLERLIRKPLRHQLPPGETQICGRLTENINQRTVIVSPTDATANEESSELTDDAKKMLSQLPIGVCVTDANERIQWANPRFCNQLGVSENDVEKLLFDELPIKSTAELGDGVYQSLRPPQRRLLTSTSAFGSDARIVVVADVTDLFTDAGGYAGLLREVVRTDADTGLLTPASVYRELFAQVARSRRYGNKLAILRIEIDELHSPDVTRSERSKTLRELGVKLADNVRNIDYAGRLSDYEFLIVLPETDTEGTQALTEKLKSTLRGMRVQTRSDKTVDCKIRFGLAMWTATDDASTLLDRARENAETVSTHPWE